MNTLLSSGTRERLIDALRSVFVEVLADDLEHVALHGNTGLLNMDDIELIEYYEYVSDISILGSEEILTSDSTVSIDPLAVYIKMDMATHKMIQD